MLCEDILNSIYSHCLSCKRLKDLHQLQIDPVFIIHLQTHYNGCFVEVTFGICVAIDLCKSKFIFVTNLY